jgi:uncharacterized protein
MLYGDSRTGKLPANFVAFGRALRRAGVPLDATRVALAQEATLAVGIDRKADLQAALEAVLINRVQDIAVFRELFDAFFRNPEVAQKLLSQMLPKAETKDTGFQRRPRVREALAPQRTHSGEKKQNNTPVEFDAAMSASDSERLRHADFNQLTASEYDLVQRLACTIALPVPKIASRRMRSDTSGTHLDWSRLMRSSARFGGELVALPVRYRIKTSAPLVILIDVSGSMERYARLLLAFLHAATHSLRQREVFAFGTHLTCLNEAFKQPDADAMLSTASQHITDFAGGTQLGGAIAALRTKHARRFIGKRSLVLLITDGLDTGEPNALEQELAWLERKCRKLLWLNPLLRFEGYQPLASGASVITRYADSMLAVHNIDKLEKLAQALAQVMKQR